MKLLHYISLLKLRYHLSFILVILGAVLFSQQSWLELVPMLLVAYFSFNVFMYGGLYTLNDITDLEVDRKHPKKKNRALPSGKITVGQAYWFAFTAIAIGLAIAYISFRAEIVLTYLVFIAVNRSYTLVGKKIPYIEIMLNGATYPLRFFLGILLVGGQATYLLLVAIFLSALGFATLRRLVEKRSPGWKARAVLQYYDISGLLWLLALPGVGIIILAVADFPSFAVGYAVLLGIYIVLILEAFWPKSFDWFFKWLFLN